MGLALRDLIACCLGDSLGSRSSHQLVCSMQLIENGGNWLGGGLDTGWATVSCASDIGRAAFGTGGWTAF